MENESSKDSIKIVLATLDDFHIMDTVDSARVKKVIKK